MNHTSYRLAILAVTGMLWGQSACADGLAHRSLTQNQMIRTYMGRLVAAKTDTVAYAAMAQEVFGPKEKTDPKYIQAEKLYIAAQSCQTGWLATLTEAVRQGELKNLAADSDFASTGDTCAAAAKKFVEFVDSNTAQSKGAFTWIGDAVDAGIKLWKEIKSERQADREAVAKRLETNAAWPFWADVGKTKPTDTKESSKDTPVKK
jgi:hypothetical protein